MNTKHVNPIPLKVGKKIVQTRVRGLNPRFAYFDEVCGFLESGLQDKPVFCLGEPMRRYQESIVKQAVNGEPEINEKPANGRTYHERIYDEIGRPVAKPKPNLIEHAIRELVLAGESDQVVEGIRRMFKAFAAIGDASPAVSSVLAGYVIQILQNKPLTPLTSNPDEWDPVPRASSMWRNNRDSRALSTDGGISYYYADEDWAPKGIYINHLSETYVPEQIEEDPEMAASSFSFTGENDEINMVSPIEANDKASSAYDDEIARGVEDARGMFAVFDALQGVGLSKAFATEAIYSMRLQGVRFTLSK